MTAESTDLALHLVDFVVGSPALKCSVLGRIWADFASCESSTASSSSVLRGVPCRRSQPSRLRLLCGFPSSPPENCHSLQIRSCSLICKTSFRSLKGIFQENSKRIISKISSRSILTSVPCGSQLFGILHVASPNTSGTFYTLGFNGTLILLDVLSF